MSSAAPPWSNSEQDQVDLVDELDADLAGRGLEPVDPEFDREVRNAVRRRHVLVEAERRYLLETRPPRPELRVLSVADMRAIPPPRWLIDGVLMERKVAFIYGPSGTFKSFIALDWACCTALGVDWAGRRVREPGRVLYIAAEGADGALRRVDAWLAARGFPSDALESRLFFIDEAVDLRDPGQLDWLSAQSNELEPVLVVVDTLARSTPGADENGAQDMGAVIGDLSALAKRGPCVLVVHHSGKSADAGMRGSSALRAGADIEWKCDRDRKKNTVKLENTKQKDEAEAATIVLSAVRSADSLAFRRASFAELQEQALAAIPHNDRVYSAIRDKPDVQQAELVRLTGMTEAQVRGATGRLVKAGLIEKHRSGPNSPVHHRVTPGVSGGAGGC